MICMLNHLLMELLLDRLDMPPCGLGVADPDLFVVVAQTEGEKGSG